MPTWLRVVYTLCVVTFLAMAVIGILAAVESGPGYLWGTVFGLAAAGLSGWLLAHALRAAVMDVEGVVITGSTSVR